MLKRCRPLLGTFVEITAEREDAVEAAFAVIARVHRLMSAHEPDSDLTRINRFAHLGPVEVDAWTAQVLDRALHWAERSGGAFDPARAGADALRSGLLPRHRHQPQPRSGAWTDIELRGRSVSFKRPACLDLGGIAKGFAVDRAVDALRTAGCVRGLVNAGGDLRGFGPQAWPIAIVDPLSRRPVAEVAVDNEALATSAGLPSDHGLSFTHLGGANHGWSSVSVVAAAACDADALTKIAWTLGRSAAAILDEAGAKAFAIGRDGGVEELSCPAEMEA